MNEANLADYGSVPGKEKSERPPSPFQPVVEQNIMLFGRDLKMTRSQLTAVTMLSIYFFLTWSYFSLFTPFFPGEALKKGQNGSQIGIIFGILQLVLLILSPFFGKYVT